MTDPIKHLALASSRETDRTIQPEPDSRYCFHWKDAQVLVDGVDQGLIEAASRLMALRFTREEKREGGLPDVLLTPEGHLHRVQPIGRFHCSTREDLLVTLVALACSRLLATTKESVIHAGGFVAEGRAVLFCGPNFAGKSSLAYTAWTLSYPVIGDDWIVVDPIKLTASAFPKPVKKRLEGSALREDFDQSISPDDRLVGRLMNDDYRLVLGKGLPNMTTFDQEFPVEALFLVAPVNSGSTVIETPTRDDALSMVLGQTMLTRTSRLRMTKLLESLRRGQRVHRIVVGENDLLRAVRMMAEKVGNRE